MRQKRDNLILNILTERKSIDVSELSELLGVSQVTVRKDLDELEKRHLISREHGIARLGNPDDINGRLAIHYDEKMKIAKAAASLVSDGDTIMIESGSCCAITAALIAKSLKNATIISNSVFIADYIRKESDINIVLLGGIYQKDSQCLVGPMIRDAVANFNVKYLFSGTDGWSRRTGFTNKDQMRAQAVRDMSLAAENVVILTESNKFSAAGTVPLNIKNDSKMIITDNNLPDELIEYFNNESDFTKLIITD